MKQYPECFNDSVRDLLKKDDDVFAFPGLHYTKDTEESIKLPGLKEPCVIISASGMAESGRVKQGIDDITNVGEGILSDDDKIPKEKYIFTQTFYKSGDNVYEKAFVGFHCCHSTFLFLQTFSRANDRDEHISEGRWSAIQM